MRTGIRVIIAAAAALARAACAEPENGGGGDADADADADGDTDGDTDADGGTDSESDTSACTPDCAGAECGDDGCGGYCGTCTEPPADSCLDGGVVDHWDPEQVGVCAVSTCVYEEWIYPCPAGSTCTTDAYGGWACSGQLPFGGLDGAASTAVWGWACDADTPWARLDLHLYFDSVPGDASPIVRVVRTDYASEAGINDACGGGDHHRFSYPPDADLLAQLGSGAHTVYAFAINSDGLGANPQIGGSPLGFTIP